MIDKVLVITAIYPDKSKYKMTQDELNAYFIEQKMDQKWQQFFWASLNEGNIAYGPIARYYIN